MAAINALRGAETRPLAGAATRPAGEAPQPPVRDEAPAPARPAVAPTPAETRAELDAALEKLNDALAKVRPEPFRVSIRNDDESGQTVIVIKDSAGEVVKQFPPEKILNLHQKMDDLIGMIVDETT